MYGGPAVPSRGRGLGDLLTRLLTVSPSGGARTSREGAVRGSARPVGSAEVIRSNG
ncbi:hypothetical protein SNL152K_10223 [Streptomyces sp. NL15-2K]|nr:hypothetical protein SNL152K_10223 [Streptomyces sp. NL15-2K]